MPQASFRRTVLHGNRKSEVRHVGLLHMTQTMVESEAQPVLLMLVDISGYTRFMVSHDRELRHSQMIIGSCSRA